MEKEKKENAPLEKVEKVEEVKKEKKEEVIKPLITSRVLFISVLDKIYLVVLILMFLGLTINNFQGDVGSIGYGFWHRVGLEIVILIFTFLMYLLLNWFYRCAVKTVLCLTKNEVYKENYVPFIRSEVSIPLNKITGVSTHKYFWIFRCIVIHQYHRFPMVFFTWTSQEFKDKLNALITTDDKKIENKYEEKNMINRDKYMYVLYALGVVAAIIFLLGIVRFFAYTFNTERKIAGEYTYQDKEIALNKDGTCEIDDIVSRVTKCNWSYDKDKKEVKLEYSYKDGYYYYYENNAVMNIAYDKSDKSLNIKGDIYKK